MGIPNETVMENEIAQEKRQNEENEWFAHGPSGVSYE